jgi:hypothetical protein
MYPGFLITEVSRDKTEKSFDVSFACGVKHITHIVET